MLETLGFYFYFGHFYFYPRIKSSQKRRREREKNRTEKHAAFSWESGDVELFLSTLLHCNDHGDVLSLFGDSSISSSSATHRVEYNALTGVEYRSGLFIAYDYFLDVMLF